MIEYVQHAVALAAFAGACLTAWLWGYAVAQRQAARAARSSRLHARLAAHCGRTVWPAGKRTRYRR